MTKFFLFHKEEVGYSSVTESDTGVGISIFAVPASSISHISASYGYVRVVFNDAGLYDFTDNNENEAIRKTTVDIDCVYGEESKLIEDILNFINVSNKTVMKFDFVNENSGFRSARKDGTVRVKVRTSPDEFTPKSISYKSLGGTAVTETSVIDGVTFATNQYPIIDFNPSGLTGSVGATAFNPNWTNSSAVGGSYYDIDNFENFGYAGYTEYRTGRTMTGLGATSLAIWDENVIPVIDSISSDDSLVLSNDYTVYYVVGIPAKTSSTQYPLYDYSGVSSLTDSWEVNTERIGGMFASNSNQTSGFTSGKAASTFAVKHSEATGGAATTLTNNTNNGTVNYSFPDKSNVLIRQTCYVFVVRRDAENNMYLHNHTGDTVGYIQANTDSSTNIGRTDGILDIKRFGNPRAEESFKGYICRIGAIETDIGSSEASRIAQELYARYNP